MRVCSEIGQVRADRVRAGDESLQRDWPGADRVRAGDESLQRDWPGADRVRVEIRVFSKIGQVRADRVRVGDESLERVRIELE